MAPLIERLEPRQFLASVAGNVFNDANGNRTKDAGEANLSGRTVYVDQNDNKKLDAAELKAVSDASGNYKISSLAAGHHLLRQVLPAGWTQTSPSGGLAHHVDVTATQNVTGKNFGAKQSVTTTRTISGKVFVDTDKDGILDAGESGKAGFKVFIDLDRDRTPDAGEPTIITDATGNYRFSGLVPASYRVQAFPTTPILIGPSIFVGTAEVSVVAGNAVRNFAYKLRSIAGRLWVDTDKDGIRDAGEAALANWRVYRDGNSNGKYDTGETSALTDVNGAYNLVASTVTNSSGNYSITVRVVQQSGYTLIDPTGGAKYVSGHVTPPYPSAPPTTVTPNTSNTHFRFTKP